MANNPQEEHFRCGTPAYQAHEIAKQTSQALQEERPRFIVRVSISGLITPILSKSQAILAKL
jgi:hypothetical protein